MVTNPKVKKGFIQYFKYSIIGFSSSIIDLGVLNGLLYFFPADHKVSLTLLNSIAYGMAVLNSYIWNSRFTFHRNATHSHKQMIAFLIQAAVSLLINDAVFVGGLIY